MQEADLWEENRNRTNNEVSLAMKKVSLEVLKAKVV
jgi:hypothetical protein